MKTKKIIKHCNEKCTEEQRAALQDELNRLALEVLEQNIPAWQYDLFIKINGREPIAVIHPKEGK